MNRLVSALCFVALWTAGAAFANAPLQSVRPIARPLAHPVAPRVVQADLPEKAMFDTTSPGLKSTIRPRPRHRQPSSGRVTSRQIAQAAGAQGVAQAVASSPHPRARPPNLTRGVVKARAPAKTQSTRVVARGSSGSICGSRTIIGERLAAIPARLPGCGVSKPVRVISVDGVKLSQAAIMDCTTAKALNSWVKKGVKPAIRRLGGGVASLSVAGHYSCRTRNNIPGEKISEHGKGRAIDISGVVLKNGTRLTVLKGWQNRTQGKLLRQMHKVACGPFGTVLGPGADKYHQDHFHLDTARQRGGSYCR